MSGSPPLHDNDASPPPSPGTTPTYRHIVPLSTSQSSAWSTDAPHHGQGTSYFPPVSPTPRRPVPRRSLSTARSTSIHSEHPIQDEEDTDDSLDAHDRGKGVAKHSTDDEPDHDETAGITERQFTDDDPLTVKDRQSLMNVDHPFGLPIWKPALYKKSRTVNRNAETALHATPTPQGDKHMHFGNIAWTLMFGWWMGLVCLLLSAILFVVPLGGRRYAPVLFGLGWYLFWPFGKYVEGDLTHGENERKAIHAPRTPGGGSTQTIRRIDEVDEDHPTPRRQPSYSTVTPHTISAVHVQTNSWDAEVANERSTLAQNTPFKQYGSVPAAYPSAAESSSKSSAHDWLGTAIFWLILITIVAPLMLLVCLVCWFLVVTIPMAKLNWVLLKHMFERPNGIRFCAAPPAVMVPSPPQASSSVSPDAIPQHGEQEQQPVFTLKRTRLSAGQAAPSGSPSSTVLLCTYRAVGLQYYKYTIGGVNIFFVNLMAVVFFAILDNFVLLPLADSYVHAKIPVPPILEFLASRALIFILSLTSVIPLSYFIGMAVASISAQSSIGMGAVINATFGSIIEIILYAIALTQGKGHLVEGSIVGSLLAGVLLMPGMSMCSGAVKKKEQRFNAKSAGVTSTMLIMAIIGTLTPTMFYQTYGNLICDGCPSPGLTSNLTSNTPWVCEHCYYEHPDPINDPFYQSTVKTLMYFCAAILLFSYLIGLWFSLRTHASQIWQNPQQLMHPMDLTLPNGPGRMSIYHRLVQSGLTSSLPTHRLNHKPSTISATSGPPSRSVTPAPRETNSYSTSCPIQHGPVPATGASAQPPSPTTNRRVSYAAQPLHPTTAGYTPFLESVNHAVKNTGMQRMQLPDNLTTDDFTRAVAVATVSALRHQQAHAQSPARLRASGPGASEGQEDVGGHGGHDAPSWSRTTSASVLLACTALYAVIAEILVDVVDVVLEGSGIDEKFLGVTLFALVPNTTEFMNAISFAMNGNIALSMEIGSAYALQVCLLQIPAMVAFSAWYDPRHMGTVADTFTLIFPRWDVIAIILSIFLLTYTYIEAKSNYHRGSILILSYVVLTSGFYFAPKRPDNAELGVFSLDKIGDQPLSVSLSIFISSVWSR